MSGWRVEFTEPMVADCLCLLMSQVHARPCEVPLAASWFKQQELERLFRLQFIAFDHIDQSC
jgi:hypothetical protein